MNEPPVLESSGTRVLALSSGPGWYPDPWLDHYYRYWDGAGWTARVHADGPPLAPPPLPPPPVVMPARGSARDFFRRHWLVTSMLASFLVGSVVATLFVNHRTSSTNTSRAAAPPLTPGTTSPTTTPRPGAPVDPAVAALSTIVVRESDVPASVNVYLFPGGNLVAGQVTLDLCNGTYASEAQRAARLQVAAFDGRDLALSTEGVLYVSGSASERAFAELKAVTASCPDTPVNSPVGEPTVTTHFNAPPDGAWPQVAGVERLAYDLTATDQTGQAEHTVAVYLRRGRVLLGIYFNQPDAAQISVEGQTTMATITNAFANRLAKLPAPVINDP